tara:strand:- start:60 stop:1379 length:1320 start_codon:yes stop_codon:yes gene_type:complete
VAAIEAFVSNAEPGFDSAPYLGDCMIRNEQQLLNVSKQLVVENGLFGALPLIGALGGDGYSFFMVWDECQTEAEELLAIAASTTGPTVPCQGALTTLPIDRQLVMGVVPLGHLNPPSHTQTTDHIYFLLPGYAEELSPSVDLFAPGQGTVVQLTKSTSDNAGPTFSDWSIEISVCAGGTIRFGHVSTISAELLALTEAVPDVCDRYGYEGYMFDKCSWRQIGVSVSVGDFLGTVGGLDTPNTALDFWAYDWDGELHFAIDPSAQPESVLRSQCALDWFVDDLRTELYAQRMEFSGTRADEGIGCGRVFQDVVGAAKGFWYSTVAVDGKWLDHLALVDDNLRSDHQVVSVASMVADPGYWIFQKQSTGTVNRDFAQVTAGSGIYCYNTFTADSNGPSGATDRFLIEMVDADTLRIEHQGGTCGSYLSFSSPHVYSRYEKK